MQQEAFGVVAIGSRLAALANVDVVVDDGVVGVVLVLVLVVGLKMFVNRLGVCCVVVALMCVVVVVVVVMASAMLGHNY